MQKSDNFPAFGVGEITSYRGELNWTTKTVRCKQESNRNHVAVPRSETRLGALSRKGFPSTSPLRRKYLQTRGAGAVGAVGLRRQLPNRNLRNRLGRTRESRPAALRLWRSCEGLYEKNCLCIISATLESTGLNILRPMKELPAAIFNSDFSVHQIPTSILSRLRSVPCRELARNTFVGSSASANGNFGPPHTSRKSTERAWSVNGQNCDFESEGIAIISSKFGRGIQRKEAPLD
jgi:hypothetical protein